MFACFPAAALSIAKVTASVDDTGGVASMINVKQFFPNSPLFFLFQEICGTATFLFHGYGRPGHNGTPVS
jgi:hypothetical protein